MLKGGKRAMIERDVGQDYRIFRINRINLVNPANLEILV